MLEANTIIVDRLALHASRQVPPRVVSSCARKVEALDPATMGIPPSAILIVRRLEDPLPGQLHRRRHPGGAGGSWPGAVARLLADIYAGAARPRLSTPPPDSNAVVFADEAEMLACLAIDIDGGNALRHWWWRIMLRRLPRPLTLERVLLAEPRLIPAIGVEISRDRLGMRILQHLAPAVTLHLLTEMLASQAAANRIAAAATTVPPDKNTGESWRAVGATGRRVTAASWNASPFARWLPAAKAEGTLLIHALFLSLAIGFHQEPGIASSAGFESAAVNWIDRQREASEPADPLDPHEPIYDGPLPLSVDDRSPRLATPSLTMDPAAANERGLPREPSLALQSSAAPDSMEREHKSNRPADLDAGEAARRGDGRVGDALFEFRQGEAPQPEASVIESETRRYETGRDRPADLTQPVLTGVGGVLFLIHLMERLGLPDCFAPDWPIADKLSRWALLELLARGLLAEAGCAHNADGIWSMLRQLDRRQELLPQSAFETTGFRLPRAWFDEEVLDTGGELCYAASGGDINIWSRAGVLIVRAPLKTNAADQAQTELAALTNAPWRWHLIDAPARDAPFARDGSLREAGLSSSLALWLGSVVPYAARWLGWCMAMTNRDLKDVVNELLVLQAKVFVTRVSVDLVAGMEDARPAVRRAALDLDPGWLPAFGRIIRFHYE